MKIKFLKSEEENTRGLNGFTTRLIVNDDSGIINRKHIDPNRRWRGTVRQGQHQMNLSAKYIRKVLSTTAKFLEDWNNKKKSIQEK